jgi:hypothetical protein
MRKQHNKNKSTAKKSVATKQAKVHTPRAKAIKELAVQFEEDLNRSLPISIQPNGNIVYKNYYVMQLSNENWGLFNLTSKDLIDQFYLKTSALIAAKLYNAVQLEKYFEIKRLDTSYWSNFSDSMIYGRNMKNAKDFDKFQVLLTRYEHSKFLTGHYKEEISRMFKWSFV